MSGPDDTQAGPALGIASELEAEGYCDAEPVGRGGFGVVYRCSQPSLDRVVAVKVLSSDPDEVDLERFDREQRAMGRLSGHPNIVPVLHSGLTFAGRPYIVMPYHRQNSLGAWIQAHGPLKAHEALTIGVRLAGALETAHRAGVLHRDVKPSNVLLTAYGEPQLSDFGIARIAGAHEPAPSTVVGSPAYTAPELFSDSAPSVAADVYSLAATMYALLSGGPPVKFRPDERPLAFVLRVTTDPIPDLRATGIPDAICSAIELGMSRDPSERPASAALFGEILRGAGAQLGMTIARIPLAIPIPTDDSPGEHGHPVSATADPAVIGVQPEGSDSLPDMQRPPSVSTRFRPPSFNRPTVPRQKILDRLTAVRRPKLVLIHAPAGYGKTTLAAQWAETLFQQGVKVAWLTINNDDNNTPWFLSHLLEALRHTVPELGDKLQQEFDGHADNARQYVLNGLINNLHQDRQHLALVIDDWHRVDNADTANAIGYLLENCCHHLHLIVTSRTRAGLPLSTLEVHNELIEIDSELLRFDVDESRALLVDQCGLDLTASHVAGLEESTDGWAAALQLASLSLRDHPDPASLIEHLSGRHRAIGEYLASNVLDRLEPRLLDFLLSTSVTERICAELATALTDIQGSRIILEEIEERDLFLRRVDAEGAWFQYHPLFAGYLQHRIERDAPDRLPVLHRKAADWFSTHAMLSQAVDHLILAGDPTQAVDLVERAAPELLDQSQLTTLLGLAAKLPRTRADARPKLQTMIAWTYALLQRRSAAQQALRLADAGISSLPAHEADDLRAETNLIRASMTTLEDRIDNLTPAVDACVGREGTLRPLVLCGAADVASFRAIHIFDFDGALKWQRWARPHHERAPGPLSVSYGYCLAGIAASELLDVAGAEAHLRHAIRIAMDPSGHPTYVAKLAGSLLGELLYERGQLDDAEALLDDAHGLGTEGGLVEFMCATFGTGALLKLDRGDDAGAHRLLDEGLEIAVKLRLPRLEARLLHDRVRILATSGADIEPALAQRITTLAGEPVHGSALMTAELRQDALIRLLLVQRTPSTLNAASVRAHARLRQIDRNRRPRAYLRASIQYALCLTTAGIAAEAEQVLGPVLKTCAALGLNRLLIDEGPPMIQLARNTYAHTPGSLSDAVTAANVSDFVMSL